MGNCLLHESSNMHWGGDDWGSPSPDEDDDASDHQPFFSSKRRRIYDAPAPVQEKGSFGNSTPTTSSRTTVETTTTTEVKIKVTKRELERLLGKVDMKELSVQEVVAQLMIIGGGGEHDDSTWRPALNSIPE